MFKPWETLAGCSLGTWSYRIVVIELLKVLERCNEEEELSGTPEFLNQTYRDMAGYDDEENAQEIMETVDEVVYHINDYMGFLPPYCTVWCEDNEWIVTPYIDDELPRVADCPEEHTEDYIYVVNDHGNVDCMYWNDSAKEYKIVWSMV